LWSTANNSMLITAAADAHRILAKHAPR
jgi:hypothetical protein